MVALSFQKQFAPPILAGTKLHTIRGERKHPIQPGQALQLYTGMRTRFCAKIGDAVCASVRPLTMVLHTQVTGGPRVIIENADGGSTCIFQIGLDEFAVSDGFRNWLEMVAFWGKHHPDVNIFDGFIIAWMNFVAAPGRLSC